MSFFQKIKTDYSRQKELRQLQKELELQAKLKEEIAAQARARDRKIISGGANIQGDGGSNTFKTSSGDTYAAGDYSDVAGTLGDPREKMDYYKQGGRVRRRLKSYFDGGLVSLRRR